MTRGDPHLVGLRKAKRGERWKERIELVTNAKEGISSDVEAIEAIEAIPKPNGQPVTPPTRPALVRARA